MKLSNCVAYYADGPLTAYVYDNGKALAFEVGDPNDVTFTTDRAAIFVNKKYQKHVEVAVAAFNAAWKAVEEDQNPGE